MQDFEWGWSIIPSVSAPHFMLVLAFLRRISPYHRRQPVARMPTYFQVRVLYVCIHLERASEGKRDFQGWQLLLRVCYAIILLTHLLIPTFVFIFCAILLQHV